MRKLIVLLCSLLCLQAAAQTADTTQEHIINFHADISIDSTGLTRVSEHIKVYAAGQSIRHGIVRFIPLYRQDVFGNKKKVDFEIVKVERDDKTESYKTEDEDGNRKIYVGNADSILANGVYSYTLIYQSRGHVGFFDGYDELYWNVTGNQWNFNIDSASATITLPKGASPGNTSCYTGIVGSKSSDCNSKVNADHSVTFIANGNVAPGEGFTVALAFTPNIIKRPGALLRWYNDYLGVTLGIVLVLLAIIVYYILWRKYGKDPKAPVVIPDFNVPYNWSPALLRYVYHKTADNTATAVAMINMAVKKTIKIKVDPDSSRKYIFEKQTDDRSKLAEEEQRLFNGLFEGGPSINTDADNANVFVNARSLFTVSISSQLKLSDYYTSNSKVAIWTGVGTVLLLAIYMIGCGYAEALPLLMFMPFIGIGLQVLINGLKKAGNTLGMRIFLIFLGLLFCVMPMISMISYSLTLPPTPVMVTFGLLVIYIVYAFLIPRYTELGVETENKLEGFKMYLETAEENRLNMLNPPERTPELFERFLPYAMALNVENAWGAKFQSILDQASYEPDWYNGNNRVSYHSFVTSVPNSFYSAVNISPPSSSSGSSSGSSGSSSWSSGSSGGGSSGGGGGGGGGGGW